MKVLSGHLCTVLGGILCCLILSNPSQAQTPPHQSQSSRWIAQATGTNESLPELPEHHRKVLWSSGHDKPQTRGRHYYKTNESRHDLFRPYVAGVRGGYIGIASSQNYNMMAWARAEFAWLLDFDDGIQDIHFIHRAFILHAPNTESFLNHWNSTHRQKSMALLRNVYKDHPQKQRIVRIFERFQQPMHQHLMERYRGPLSKTYPNWLSHPPSYRYIRRMYQTHRIRILFGDLLGTKTLQGIGTVARQSNMPIRVLYLSNAEEWFSYRPSFRQNIQALPFDKHSVVIRTMWEKEFQPRSSDDWQYNVQQGLHFQKILSHPNTRSVFSLNPWMTLAKEWGLTLIGVSVR